jgi:IclR family transcriptional regulator, KDG regulon repressor
MKAATTVTKVCRIMEQFHERQSLGVTDLAKSTGLLPSDVHRILSSLRANHYVDQDPDTKKYRLGVALMRLGLTALERNVLREKARPILLELSKRIGATTHLALLDEQRLELILVHQIKGPSAAMFQTHLGEVEHLHSTALGKTVLASLDRQTLRTVLQRNGMARSTSHTITDAGTLETQLEEIQRCGYAVDREEFTPSVCCIGSAVRDRTDAVAGAISASMPSALFLSWNEARLGAILKGAASKLSTIIGHVDS